MTRIVTDKNGDYDLAHVVAITKIPQRRQLPTGSFEDTPPVARLHYKGGTSYPTLLPHEFVRDEWLKVKSAESHPSEDPQETDCTQ